MYQLINDDVGVSNLREVSIEDLLGRDTIEIDMESVGQYVRNKRVLVTGGGGSIGSELCRQIASHNPKLLIILISMRTMPMIFSRNWFVSIQI